MRASFIWLKEFVYLDRDVKEVAHALTMTGLEVEGIDDIDGDSILEINVTPNRPDCLSILGIARELSAIYEIPLNLKTHAINEVKGKLPDIRILQPELCQRYACRPILDVNVQPSPLWMQKRLEAHGFRPINNIVDVTNYVLIEMGHPLHAFDYDRIKGNELLVGRLKHKDNFLTLDGIEREISPDMLLIMDRERPIAIAGVMGGENTEVTSDTRNILLESAYFSPSSVRRTSRALNLRTDASYRFERGTDIEGLVMALNRAAQLISELAGGSVLEKIDVYPDVYIYQTIDLSTKKLNSVLGTGLRTDYIADTLKRLNLTIEGVGEDMKVTPPTYRRDIRRDIDLIEEVARLYGYDRILTTLPAGRMLPLKSSERAIVQRIKDIVRGCGYTEVINYSFLDPVSLDTLHLPEADRRMRLIRILNPLRKEEEALRTTLVPALIDNLILNIRRAQKDIRLFEVSKVFFSTKDEMSTGSPKNLSPSGVKEVLTLAGILFKGEQHLLWKNNVGEFFRLKGCIESIFFDLKITDYSFQTVSGNHVEPFLHPNKSARVAVAGEFIGYLGILHPDIEESMGVDGEIAIFEIDMDRLTALCPKQIKYRAIPRYPSVDRDVAVVVDDTLPAIEIEKAIRAFPASIIESVRLFDVYKGANILEGKKSLAFSICYRADNRTLTAEEVDDLHMKIAGYLKKTFGAWLRS